MLRGRGDVGGGYNRAHYLNRLNRYGRWQPYINTANQLARAARNYGAYAVGPAVAAGGYKAMKSYGYGSFGSNNGNGNGNGSGFIGSNSGGPYSNVGRRPRTYRNRRRRRKKKLSAGFSKNQKKYIKKIADGATDDENVCTWRDIDSGKFACLKNSCAYTSVYLMSRTQIELAIDGAKMLDPNAGTLTEVTVDLTTIDGLSTKILNSRVSMKFRNNGQAPCDLKVYWLSFKKRGLTTPNALLEDGLENAGITVNETTDLRFDVYDSKTYNDFIKIWKTKTYRLNGGDEVDCVLRRNKPYMYDPDEYDKHNASEYVPGMTQALHFRLSGVIAHDDTTSALVGTCDASLDYVYNEHIKFSAAGGTQLKNLLTGDKSLDTMTADAKMNVREVEEVTLTL